MNSTSLHSSFRGGEKKELSKSGGEKIHSPAFQGDEGRPRDVSREARGTRRSGGTTREKDPKSGGESKNTTVMEKEKGTRARRSQRQPVGNSKRERVQ